MRVAVISSARWSSFHVSKQFVAAALARRGHQVLYVDPPVSPGSLVRHPNRWRDLVGPRASTSPDGVDVWHPIAVPGQNHPLGQRANGRIVASGIRRRLGQPDLSIVFSLEGRGMIRRLPGHRIYYVTDSAVDLPGAHPSTREWEQVLIDSADTVVACSLPISDEVRSRGADPIYIPHGCDPAFVVERHTTPPEMVGLSRPLLGYVGSLNFRIDTSLLEPLLSVGTLVVVGSSFGPPPSDETRALLADPRVVTLAHRPPSELPDYIAALDVGLVPYTATAFNRKSFPIKVLQYLGAGLPVVSTPNGATDELGAAVRVAGDPASFAVAVADALEDRAPEAARSRRELARSRTWDSVAAQIEALCAPGPGTLGR